MKIILVLLLLSIGCYHVAVDAQKCTRPNVSRTTLHVYSNIGKISVRVNRCAFNGAKGTYSDVSDNCVRAFKSGVFLDKWSEEYTLAAANSPVIVEEYLAKADLTKNEIYLKSGSKCRYDRGFCFDPVYGNTYAVVWEILNRTKVECASELYKVFEGEVDIWDFQPQGLSYLFYYDNFMDDAFYLRLKTKGRCQDNDIWYTEEGYIVSKNPLKAKGIELSAAIKNINEKKGGTKGGVKSGVKGGVKGSNKAAKFTFMPPNQNYFYLKPKRLVSENVLKNCELQSIEIEQIIEEIDSSYVDNPDNLRLLLKRYYDFINKIKNNLLTVIKSESAINLTLDLKRELQELSKNLETTIIDLKTVHDILESAGNLKDIRIDVDKLVDEIKTLLRKNEDYDNIFEQLSTTVKKNGQKIKEADVELQVLTEKIEKLQTLISNQLPNLITKTDVYEKMNEIEQKFHNKVKELTMNVTLLLLQHEGPNGVKGKGTTNTELENLILEKLKSFNLDQQQAAIDALKEKHELLMDQIRFETYNNASILEDRLTKKIDDLASKHAPILDQLTDIEKNITTINNIINNLKLDTETQRKQNDKIIKDLQSNIDEIWTNSSNLEQVVLDLKNDLLNLSEKEVDFSPVYKKLDDSLVKEFKQRDERLDSLDDITSKLTDYIQKSNSDIENLEKQINETNALIKDVDSLKDSFNDNIVKEVIPVQKKLNDLNAVLTDHSNKHTTVHNDLEETKNNMKLELDTLKANMSDMIDQLNSALEKNSGLIEKLLEQDNVTNNTIDNLKKDLIEQGQSIKNLESQLQENNNKSETIGNSTLESINNLKENVTEIFDAIKQHEGSILELIKSFEKITTTTVTKSAVKTSNTKGGVKTSQSDSQEKEIYFLRTKLTGVYMDLNSKEQKIKRLEREVEQLYGKMVKFEAIFSDSMKSVHSDMKGTNDRIEYVEFDIKSRLENCCGNKMSYQAPKPTKVYHMQGIKTDQQEIL